ncbi:MAG: RICIN domain-containing protein, partial [Porphyromonadaceae bacterium]|nr:RICIN domain-containing protein [Porphyromonadaceae bacterium]
MKKKMKRIGISLLVSVMLLNTTAFAGEFSNQDLVFGEENTDELEKPESDVDTEIDDSTQLEEPDSSLDVEDDKVQETPDVEEEENSDDESDEEELTVESEESVENIEKEEELENPKDSFDKLAETVIEDGWYSICPASNQDLCLDVDSYSEADGANIQLFDMKQNFAQRFYIFQKENGWYGIQNVASNKMLGVMKEGETRICQYTINNLPVQEFKFYEDESGNIIIRANNEDGKVLDIKNASIKKGGRLQLYKYNASNAQKFFLKRWKKLGEMMDVEEGNYRIYPSNAPRF